MKVQQHHNFARGLSWDQYEATNNMLSLVCKRLRPLAPKISSANKDTTTVGSFDLKSFIRPNNGQRKPLSLDHDQKKEPAVQLIAETQQLGGTRWNPTQEQVGILETLYKNGMRTPNAQQIEHITSQLRNFGKIEGKNVFYWFQNHKARDRQKQKRSNNNLGKHQSPRTLTSPVNTSATECGAGEELEGNYTTPYKRKCNAWSFDHCVEEQEDRTLKLFPLHPEGRFLN